MSSDQKFTTLTADGQVKTFSGGSTNIGPARVTYIQATGVTNIKLYDASTASGGIVLSEGNCKSVGPNGGNRSRAQSTIGFSSGKWYAEFRLKTLGSSNGEVTWGWLVANTFSGNGSGNRVSVA